MKERGESLMLSENEQPLTGPGAGFDGLSLGTFERVREHALARGRGDGAARQTRRDRRPAERR